MTTLTRRLCCIVLVAMNAAALKVNLKALKKGGKIRVLAASRYAYGPYPQDGIGLPANSVVDFEIELLDVTN